MTRSVNSKLMTRSVNSKLKSCVLAKCCHYYGMTYYINTTTISALFFSCTHTPIQMCEHFMCYSLPSFLVLYSGKHGRHTHYTGSHSVLPRSLMMETRVARIYAVLTCKSAQHHNRDTKLGQCHHENLKLHRSPNTGFLF